MAQMIKAVALVGFYRGDLVQPGQVLELPFGEFAELKAFYKVDYAPVEKVNEQPAPKRAKE